MFSLCQNLSKMGACCPGGNSKAFKKSPPPPCPPGLLSQEVGKPQKLYSHGHPKHRHRHKRHALNAAKLSAPKSTHKKIRFRRSKRRLAKPLILTESESVGSGSGSEKPTTTTSSEDDKTRSKPSALTSESVEKTSTIAKPLGGLMANKVMSVASMGVENFRKNLGTFAPTTPLILLFTNQNDDHFTLKSLMESMSNKFKTAVFLKAPIEKNMVSQQRFNITNTPTWIAFKNHVPVGRVVGTNPADVSELVRVVFELQEEGKEGGGGGQFTMFNPF